MSRNSRLKRSKKKKKGPGPGDKPRKTVGDISAEDPIYKATDTIDTAKASVARNDTPIAPPIRRSTQRGS